MAIRMAPVRIAVFWTGNNHQFRRNSENSFDSRKTSKYKLLCGCCTNSQLLRYNNCSLFLTRRISAWTWVSFLAYPAVNTRKSTRWNLSCLLSIVSQLLHSTSKYIVSIVYSWSKFYPLSVFYTQTVVCVLYRTDRLPLSYKF